MLDAVRSNAIEYEARSYSRPLEYDAVAQKAVILDHGDQKYTGPPSLEIDAAWTDLLRGKNASISLGGARSSMCIVRDLTAA